MDQSKKEIKNNMQENNPTQKYMVVPTTAIRNEEDNVTILIDDKKTIHSIKINTELLQLCNKKEIINKLTDSINKAILQKTQKNIYNIDTIVEHKDFENIFPNDTKEIRDNLKKLITNVAKRMKNIHLITYTLKSESGNIELQINGLYLIQFLEIENELLSIDNREKLERELSITFNKAITDIQRNIREEMVEEESEIMKT